MNNVYVGLSESLGPAGFLDSAWVAYCRGEKKLQSWVWGERPFLLGKIPSEIMGEGKEFWQVCGPERPLLALERLCAKIGSQWHKRSFDAVIVGGGRMRPIQPPGESSDYALPLRFLDQVQRILNDHGFHFRRPRPVFVEASCVTGVALLDLARKRIFAGKAKQILIISFDTIQAESLKLMDSFGILTAGELPVFPEVWTDTRDGFARSEAISAVVISASPMEDRPLRLIGTSICTDAMGVTSMDPQGKGLSNAIEHCLLDAGVKANDVAIVKAHATGTRMNDLVESQVLQSCCGGQLREKLVIAFKSLFGHTMNASAIFELTLLKKCLEQKRVFNGLPSMLVNRKEINNSESAIDEHALALGIAMGFGGINGAYLVQREAP